MTSEFCVVVGRLATIRSTSLSRNLFVSARRGRMVTLYLTSRSSVMSQRLVKRRNLPSARVLTAGSTRRHSRGGALSGRADARRNSFALARQRDRCTGPGWVLSASLDRCVGRNLPRWSCRRFGTSLIDTSQILSTRWSLYRLPVVRTGKRFTGVGWTPCPGRPRERDSSLSCSTASGTAPKP